MLTTPLMNSRCFIITFNWFITDLKPVSMSGPLGYNGHNFLSAKFTRCQPAGIWDLTVLTFQVELLGLQVKNISYSLSTWLPHSSSIPLIKTAGTDLDPQKYFSESGGSNDIPTTSFTLLLHVEVETCPNYIPQVVDNVKAVQLWEAALNQNGTNIRFRIGEKVFFVHSFVLAARSPVFAAMFKQVWLEGKNSTIDLPLDLDPDIFLRFLEFVYTGFIDVSFIRSPFLLELSDMYNIDTLKSMCDLASEEKKKIFN